MYLCLNLQFEREWRISMLKILDEKILRSDEDIEEMKLNFLEVLSKVCQ